MSAADNVLKNQLQRFNQGCRCLSLSSKDLLKVIGACPGEIEDPTELDTACLLLTSHTPAAVFMIIISL